MKKYIKFESFVFSELPKAHHKATNTEIFTTEDKLIQVKIQEKHCRSKYVQTTSHKNTVEIATSPFKIDPQNRNVQPSQSGAITAIKRRV